MNGAREMFRALKAKIVGDPLPPRAVAGGWALGMFVGCAVPFGLQLVVSVPIAFLLRLSKVGATVGTLVTNPLTIFFIYPAQTAVMFHLLYGSRELGSLPSEWTWAHVQALSGPVIASFFLGGLALALILTPITYIVVMRIVLNHRKNIP